MNALTVNLTNSGDITGGTSGATATGRHALKLDAGNSTIVNTGKITSTKGRGISGLATTVITTLTNQTGTALGSGTISGSTDGIAAGRIGSLTNSGTIRGNGGAGIILSGPAVGNTVTTTVTNSGTIQGRPMILTMAQTRLPILKTPAPAALEPAACSISTTAAPLFPSRPAPFNFTGTASRAATIANSGTIQGAASGLNYGTNAISSLTNTGMIQGGSGPALRAGAIGTLNNTGTLRSTSGPAIEATGLNKLTNSGTIEG